MVFDFGEENPGLYPFPSGHISLPRFNGTWAKYLNSH